VERLAGRRGGVVERVRRRGWPQHEVVVARLGEHQAAVRQERDARHVGPTMGARR
jgi:hypothetical protein